PWRKRTRSAPVTRNRPQLVRSTIITAPYCAYFFLAGAAGFLAAFAVSIRRLIRALSLAWVFLRFIFGVRRLSPRPMRVSLWAPRISHLLRQAAVRQRCRAAETPRRTRWGHRRPR